MGLKLKTLGSRAACSTNWASQGPLTEPLLKLKTHSSFNITKLYNVKRVYIKNSFTHAFRKFIFSSISVKRSGGEGVLSPLILGRSCLKIHFPRENFGFLSQLSRLRFHVRETNAQLSCLGSTAGRQNSCCFRLPGCKQTTTATLSLEDVRLT